MTSDMDALQLLETLSAGQSAILVTVAAGMLGLIVAYCLSTRGSASKAKEEAKTEVEEISSEPSAKKSGGSELQRKQWKAQNTGRSRKASLPSHSLLAADFKGHTGAVLSLDFDSTGRYLVSCSEGKCALATKLCAIPSP